MSKGDAEEGQGDRNNGGMTIRKARKGWTRRLRRAGHERGDTGGRNRDYREGRMHEPDASAAPAHDDGERRPLKYDSMRADEKPDEKGVTETTNPTRRGCFTLPAGDTSCPHP